MRPRDLKWVASLGTEKPEATVPVFTGRYRAHIAWLLWAGWDEVATPQRRRAASAPPPRNPEAKQAVPRDKS